MKNLFQTEKYSVVYGDFHGENQELFRCPRELDDQDLARYVNETRCFLGFDDDLETNDLRNVADMNMIGYFRMYFRDGSWYGRWMIEKEDPSKLDCHGVQEIIDWICDNFEKGCDYFMKDYFNEYHKPWGQRQRYLVKPKYSKHYKVMIDTTYGNGDYPVRIYVYKEKEEI